MVVEPEVLPVEVVTPKTFTQEEVDKLTAERDAEVTKAKEDLGKVVNELVELRKKKSVSPEEKEKLEVQVKDLEQKLTEANKVKVDAVLNSLASTPSGDSTPKSAGANSQLSARQEELRKEKGWTVEKYLQMKEKYPKIVL